MWQFPTRAPVARIEHNLRLRIEQDQPAHAEPYFSLARAHSLAFSSGGTEIAVIDREGRDLIIPPDESDPGPGPDGVPYVPEGAPPIKPLTGSERIRHLLASIEMFKAALDRPFHPDNKWGHHSSVELGLAYVLEHGQPIAERLGFLPLAIIPHPSEQRLETLREAVEVYSSGVERESMDWLRAWGILEDDADAILVLVEHVNSNKESLSELARRRTTETWRELAIEWYLKAFRSSFDRDLASDEARDFSGNGYDETVSFEAGSSYLRMVTARGVQPDERSLIEEVNRKLGQLESREWSTFITPIILSLSPRPLADLIDDAAFVPFDLDGTRRPQRWTWVTPDAAILCWDPERTGRITSGRQLFGNATFWLLPENGYAALDMLDDNRDGELAGAELTGLALWHDLNTNGVSDPGEVVPIEHTPIAGIATTYDSTEGRHLVSHAGLRLASGDRLPTYDWIALSPESEATK